MHITLPYEKGAPRALSSEVEGRLAKMIYVQMNWENVAIYPIGNFEIKLMLKDILDRSKTDKISKQHPWR